MVDNVVKGTDSRDREKAISRKSELIAVTTSDPFNDIDV